MFHRDELEIYKEGIESIKNKRVEDIIDSHIEALKLLQEYKSHLSDLISAVYEHANNGTALMEIAEKIDGEI